MTDAKPYRYRVYICPAHGRVAAEYYLSGRVTFDPMFHPGCVCEKWAREAQPAKAKRTSES